MKKTDLYSKAVQLAVQGFSIIPVGPDKRPLLMSWKEYQKEAATTEQIEKWWEMWPDANIGIVTGKVSGISVIDLDTRNGELLTPLSTFPETFTIRTGNGGYHLYYKYHPGLSISAGAYPQFPGLDIRSDGGFVVGPFSKTSYEKNGKKLGGTYSIETAVANTAFPASLFPVKKERRTLTTKMGVSSGGRNDSIASFAGQLLQSAKEEEWESEVWPAVERANKTYSPPLPLKELRTTFESIAKKEIERRATLIISPMQIDGGEDIPIRVRKNSNGHAYKDMANVLAVLSQHPYYKDNIRYNEFRQEIEYNGKPLEEADLVKIQYFMQTEAEFHGIAKEAVYAAVQHYANLNRYDEAKDWLQSLEWDKKPRLSSWIHQATGVENDEYHSGIGAQWIMGLVRRIMEPGCTFDYVLLLVGPQGIGKTSFFRIIGGKWYKSYTGAMDNKDFYLALRGALVLDLDEGAAMYKSEAIKMKSIVTETHDEFRAPYDRVMKRYPRRFCFSMSTNDTEPFRDATGNRRYWAINAEETIKFKWLEENRDQIFAEAYYMWKNNKVIPQIPLEATLARQDMFLPDDTWTDLVMQHLRKFDLYCEGSPEFYTTVSDVYKGIFPEESMSRVGTSQAMRITMILKKTGGLEKRRMMIDGERTVRWMITPKRMEELKKNNVPSTRLPLEDEFI
jgi:predicted P-loop ATPase